MSGEAEASSIDGREFTYRTLLASLLPAGSYVRLEIGDSDCRLGQVLTQELIRSDGADQARGWGNLLARLRPRRLDLTLPSGSFPSRPSRRHVMT